MIFQETTLTGRQVLACDGRCRKAWGINARPAVPFTDGDPDSFLFLPDNMLGSAPDVAGCSEDGENKPQQESEKLRSKWCIRECERSVLARTSSDVELPDFTRFVSND